MATLSELTEQLASSVLLADATDLVALAALHEKLISVPKQVAAGGGGGVAPPVGARVSQAASVASRLVEQIILREVDDANAALDRVCGQIAELQQLLSGGIDVSTELSSSPAGSPQPAGASPQTAPATSPAEHGTSAPSVAPSTFSEEPLPKAEDFSLVQDFLVEAREHLATAEADLLKLEESPEDSELLNSVFRSFHTIKGVAGFLNLRQIGKLGHAAETLLDLARKGKLTIVGGTLDLVLSALDLTKALMVGLETALNQGTAIPADPRLPPLLERLQQASTGTPTPAATSPSAPRPAAATTSPATLAPVTAPSIPSSAPRAEAEGPRPANGPAAPAESTVKVATVRLDALINMVGELVISQAMVSQDMSKRVGEDQRVARNLAHLGKITRELQDLTMAMRMVPIQGVFQKMSRLVRDLARKAGKEINLVIEGGETELDRNLVEAIGDPLVHMVRNSADHGIENGEDREKAGKPRAGRVGLKAYHQAGNIVIEISDDGRGLNKERILQKARDSGLVKEGQELSEQEIFRLIFAPGLSTAEKVTDVSGRGVGMDVVRRNVEALRGRIDIVSAVGKGSVFSIRLPLTLAVIDGLVIMVGTERYIVPITSIEQSLRPKREQISTVQNRGEMCMVRNALLPVFRLHKLFNVPPKQEDPWNSLLVLVQDGERRCCLLVDELLGQQQVVIKSLGEATASVPGVSGGAILGDGTISLILDVPGLMDLVARTQ